MAQLVAKRYSVALFELAQESGQLDERYEQVGAVYEIMKTDQDLVRTLENPQISSDEKIRILEAVFKGKVSDDLLGLFALALRKSRENEIMDMLLDFIRLYKQNKGITEAIVYSAVALSDSQVADITSKLSQKLNKQVTIVTEVDPSLIGGLCVKVDGHIMDGTIKSGLHDLKKQLLNIKLA